MKFQADSLQCNIMT